MTWRERIQAAKERGFLSSQDKEALWSYNTCLVEEQRRLYPEVVVYLPATRDNTVCPADTVLRGLGNAAPFCQDADDLDRLLDKIEDRVLQLKREFHDARA